MSTPIDYKTGMKIVKDKKQYKNMIKTLVPIGFQKSLEELKTAIPIKDYTRIHKACHSLKGNTSWVGCGRIYKNSWTIVQAYYQKDFELMIELYPTLIETIVEVKRYLPIINSIINRKKLKTVDNTGESLTCLVAEGYNIKYDEFNDYCYCLKGN